MAPPRSVSPSDADLVGLYRALRARLGLAPTVREMADAAGLATHSAMHRHLLRLRGRLFEWEDGKARTLRILDQEHPAG